MHRMNRDAGIDDSKLDRVTDIVRQSLRFRPGFAVDREAQQLLAVNETARRSAPESNHQYAIPWLARRAVRVDDECTVQLSVGRRLIIVRDADHLARVVVRSRR